MAESKLIMSMWNSFLRRIENFSDTKLKALQAEEVGHDVNKLKMIYGTCTFLC